jgi:hypothetical protein
MKMAQKQELLAMRDGRAMPQLLVVLLLFVAVFSAGHVSAAEITYVSVTGTWHDPVDTSAGYIRFRKNSRLMCLNRFKLFIHFYQTRDE